MIFRICFASAALLFAQVFFPVAKGQEEEIEPNKIESEKTLEQKEHEKELNEATLHGKPTKADNAANWLRNPIHLGPKRATATFVTSGPESFEFQNSGEHAFHDINDPNLFDSYVKGDVFILSSNLTKADEQRFKARNLPFVIHSRVSPKGSPAELSRAALLTILPFKPDNAVILNALPQETGQLRPSIELKRMGLTSTPEEWSAAREQIREAAGNTLVQRATKESVIKEFREGTKDILFVIAHSDSQSIFLPGLNGGKLSFEELKSVTRKEAPNRVIVLLACRTAKAAKGKESIAEILLKNRLATAVLASENNIYASSIAGIFHTLIDDKGNLNQSFKELSTIVMRFSTVVEALQTRPTERR